MPMYLPFHSTCFHSSKVVPSSPTTLLPGLVSKNTHFREEIEVLYGVCAMLNILCSTVFDFCSSNKEQLS